MTSPQHGLLAHPPLVESPEAVQAATRIQAVQRGRNVRREIDITKPLRVGRVVRAPGSRVESGRVSHRSLRCDDDNVADAAPAHAGVRQPPPLPPRRPPPALPSSTHVCIAWLSVLSFRFGCSPEQQRCLEFCTSLCVSITMFSCSPEFPRQGRLRDRTWRTHHHPGAERDSVDTTTSSQGFLSSIEQRLQSLEVAMRADKATFLPLSPEGVPPSYHSPYHSPPSAIPHHPSAASAYDLPDAHTYALPAMMPMMPSVVEEEMRWHAQRHAEQQAAGAAAAARRRPVRNEIDDAMLAAAAENEQRMRAVRREKAERCAPPLSSSVRTVRTGMHAHHLGSDRFRATECCSGPYLDAILAAKEVVRG